MSELSRRVLDEHSTHYPRSTTCIDLAREVEAAEAESDRLRARVAELEAALGAGLGTYYENAALCGTLEEFVSETAKAFPGPCDLNSIAAKTHLVKAIRAREETLRASLEAAHDGIKYLRGVVKETAKGWTEAQKWQVRFEEEREERAKVERWYQEEVDKRKAGGLG